MNDPMTNSAWAVFDAKLHAYVRGRINASAVDDVVSDILLNLFRSQDKMAGAKSPLAWMYRVAANVIADHHRKSAREKRLMEGAKSVLQDPGTPGAPAEKEEAEDSAALARCLVPMIKNLPPPYDGALMLTEIDGVTQVAAAKQLGLSVSGMKSRVQRGRQKLKASLLRCCAVEVNRRGDVVNHEARDKSCCCT